MSVSTTTAAIGAWCLAAVAATGLFMVSPFTEDPPTALPPPPMEVVCSSVDMTDPGGAPVLGGCYYQGYPVQVRAPSPNPL